MPNWRRLLTQEIRLALSLALDKAGRSIPAKMAMMAITTSNSISVKAVVLRLGRTVKRSGLMNEIG